jgi:mannose-6-phosphate isomerase-like protein (cupin superfamily)
MTMTPSPRRWHEGEGEALWFLGNFLTVKVGGQESRGRLTVIDFVNPPGFAPPLHRHEHEEEVFYVLEGTATFLCDAQEIPAGPGDLVHLPAGLPHTFKVDAAGPLRVLQITTPAGFEDFAREAGEPALTAGLPDVPPTAEQVAALMEIAPRYDMEILGPPPA